MADTKSVTKQQQLLLLAVGLATSLRLLVISLNQIYFYSYH